jgi:hypothetical protein
MLSPTGNSLPLSISRVQYYSESESSNAYNIPTDRSGHSNKVETEGSSTVALPTSILSPTVPSTSGGLKSASGSGASGSGTFSRGALVDSDNQL